MPVKNSVTKASQRHSLVTIQGIPLIWRSMSGGGVSGDYTRDYDGGSDVADFIPGYAEAEDIEVTCTVAPLRDKEWMDRVKAQVLKGRYTITRQWTDANWDPVGQPETYPNCLLIGYNNPEVSASADPAEFTLTFATNGQAL